MSLALTPLVFLPLTHALFLNARRAIFPWVTWYVRFFEKVDEFFLHAVWLPVPFLILGTALALRRLTGALVKRWAKRPAGEVRRPLRWAAGVIMAAVMIPSGAALAVVLIIDLQLYGPHITPSVVAGAVVHQARCVTSCHSTDNVMPLCIVRRPERWQPILRRMRTARGVSMSDWQAALVLDYLKLRGSYPDARLFEAKCHRCHDEDRLTARPRGAREWALIIDRVARVSPFAFRDDWRVQLKRHARRRLASAAARAGPKLRFEQRCGACHTLGLAARGVTPAVLRRMAAKVPGTISAADRAAVEAYVKTLPREPARLRSLFPHDRAVEFSW